MCYCCKCDANAMQGERIKRKGDIPICDIPIYRETERLGDRKPSDRETRKSRDWEIERTGDWETEILGDWETEILGDREQKSAGGRKVNNRVSIANAPK